MLALGAEIVVRSTCGFPPPPFPHHWGSPSLGPRRPPPEFSYHGFKTEYINNLNHTIKTIILQLGSEMKVTPAPSPDPLVLEFELFPKSPPPLLTQGMHDYNAKILSLHLISWFKFYCTLYSLILNLAIFHLAIIQTNFSWFISFIFLVYEFYFPCLLVLFSWFISFIFFYFVSKTCTVRTVQCTRCSTKYES